MSLPAAQKQVHSIANVSQAATWFSLDETGHLGGDRYDMRMNVVCCPQEGNWPLVLDDCGFLPIPLDLDCHAVESNKLT